MTRMREKTRMVLAQIDDPGEAVYLLMSGMANQMHAHDCGTGAPIAAVALEASNASERLRKACSAGYQGMQDVIMAKLVMSGFSAERAQKLATTAVAAFEGAVILARTHQRPSTILNVAAEIRTIIQNSSRD